MRAGIATCVQRTAAALLAGLALLAMAPTAGATGQSAMIRVAATIMSYVKVTGLSNPPEVEISAADAARGYVDVDAVTSLSLLTNSPDGYLITATHDSTLARVTMRVTGPAGTASGPDRVQVPAVAFVKTVLRIGYRLYLSPGIAAGRYPWPVALSVGRA